MIIDCIADLHGHYPKLEGGDLLIVPGDLTATDTEKQYEEFSLWLNTLAYRKVIVIAGNHDNYLSECSKVYVKPLFYHPTYVEYLCDSVIEFEGLKIWGSPWTKTFEGMNPDCKAFTCDTEEELSDKWTMIPSDVDILITHSPPYGILDEVEIYGHKRDECNEAALDTKIHVGSKSLALKIGHMKNPPKLWCWGHIHEAYGQDLVVRSKPCKMINCSHVNERGHPINKPVRVIL